MQIPGEMLWGGVQVLEERMAAVWVEQVLLCHGDEQVFM